MLLSLILATTTIAGAPGCASHGVPPNGGRFPSRAFKGVELYSWRTPAGEFRYSLHWGTNRAKSENEVKFPSCTMVDVTAVKTALSRLAEGEWVTWLSDWNLRLSYPDAAVVQDLVEHARKLGITLHVPPEGSRRNEPSNKEMKLTKPGDGKVSAGASQPISSVRRTWGDPSSRQVSD